MRLEQRLRVVPGEKDVVYGLGIRPPRAARVPRIVAASVAASGLLTLGSIAFPGVSGRLGFISDVPLAVRFGADSVAAIAGFGLLVIAGGLARRQRHAWWIALLLLVSGGVSHFVRDVDVLAAGVSLGAAAVLVMTRDEFDAKPGPRSIRRAIFVLPGLALVVWVFGWLLIMGHSGSFSPVPSPGEAAVAAFRGAIGFPLGLGGGGGVRWISDVLPLLGVAALVSAFVALFRPLVGRAGLEEADPEEVRGIIRRFGDDSLAYFALREDKDHFVHGDAVVSYRYLWNLALASGDPVGDPDQVAAAFAAFAARVRGFGWGLAVLAARDDLAPVYSRLGLRQFYLGDEAVIDLRTFSLEGRPIRKVRQSCNRLNRLGYTLEFLNDDEVGHDLRDSLETISHHWRGRAPERGFTMALGRLPSERDPDCMTVVARDAGGRAQGYLHLVPCRGTEPGYSVDQTRRRLGTPNGMTEWAIAQTALALRGRGMARLSLNFAFLAGLLGSPERLTRLQRLEAAIVRPFTPFFQIESLRLFNEQFHPMWIPRYVYYEPPFSLPRVAIAYLEAEAFVSLPLVGARGRLRRRHEARSRLHTARSTDARGKDSTVH